MPKAAAKKSKRKSLPKRKPVAGFLNQVKTLKIIVEKHSDGYVAYPVGIEGVVVGQGDTFEAALQDVKSAIKFHVETFGPEILEPESPALDAFVAETTV